MSSPMRIRSRRSAEVVDGAAVILGVDDGGGFRGEAGEILPDGHAADVGVGRQEGLQRHGRRDLAHPDQAAGGLEDGLMQRLEEVLRLQEVGDPVEGVVVDQDRAEQALFRLDIVRRAPKDRSSRVGGKLEDVRISQGHGGGYSSDWVEIGILRAGRAIKRPSPAKRKQKLCAMHRSSKMWMNPNPAGSGA